MKTDMENSSKPSVLDDVYRNIQSDDMEITLKDKVIQPHRQFWTKSEKKQWVLGLFTGTTMLYSARTIMPLCITSIANEMKWDKSQSGTVLSAFFWGYCMTQFLGGYLSDKIGGEIVIPVAACMWSLVTFWTPQFVYLVQDKNTALYIIVLSRVLLGIFQGFHYPSLTSIISKKVLDKERSLTYSVVASGSHFGTLLCGCIGSVLLENYGWQLPFYVIGLSGLAWMLLVRHLLLRKYFRKRNPIMTDHELLSKDYSKTAKAETRESVPWVTLFTKPAFWSLLVGHFCENNAFYILLSWMPTYFHENFPTAKGWMFNVVPWVVTIPSSIFSGWLADRMISNGYSVTFVRKLMETIALSGTAFFLFAISYVNSYVMCLLCLALAVACCGFHGSGILVNPQDIAPKHAGSVFGIMNMAGAVPGFVGVYVAGHILETTKSWNAVFNQTSVICIFGLVVYLAFGTGKKIV